MNSATLAFKHAQETIRNYQQTKKRSNQWKDSEIWILSRLYSERGKDMTQRAFAAAATAYIERNENAIRAQLNRLLKVEDQIAREIQS